VQEGVKIMTGIDLKRLTKKLIEQRREFFRDRLGLDEQWETLGQREIEHEEEAQKANLTELFGQLEEREQREIEAIDLALGNMTDGTFGICERCERKIPSARLESLPAARLCVACAAEEEERTKIPSAAI